MPAQGLDITQLLQLGGFIVIVLGTAFTAWWRVMAAINAAKGETALAVGAASSLAALVREELAEHRLHVAETYISKAGFRDSTEQIMAAIKDVNTSVGQMRERIDRVFDKAPSRPTLNRQ